MDKKFVKGFVTNIGGTTSHTAIMARSMNIPSIVGTNNVLENVNNDDLIALNGSNGTLIINPTENELKEFQKLLDEYNAYLSEIKSLIGKPSVSSDNHKVEIAANIGRRSKMLN